MAQLPTGQQTPAAYSYGAYRPPGTFGSYPPMAPYQTGVTGYGSWPYQYSYVPQSVLQTPRPAIPTGTSATYTPTYTHPIPQRMPATSYTPAQPRDTVTAPTTGLAAGRPARKQHSSFKGLFTKELKSLMYGFGDDRNPANDTVDVMEEILIEFIIDVCSSAGGPNRKTRLMIEDLRRALSRPADAKKLARMEELLFMQEDIKRGRAQFDISHPTMLG